MILFVYAIHKYLAEKVARFGSLGPIQEIHITAELMDVSVL